jgi:ribosomal protein S18 acetylase RimI-like enzyme
MCREIVVRNYCTEDLGDIKEILSDYSSPTGRVWNENLVEEMMTDALKEQPDGVFVAAISGKVVGFAIVVYREWFNIAYLDYIQVKTDQINKGVGHKLIEKCINWAQERGARIIYTETGKNNERAIEFYKRHGFKITGCIPDYYQKGLDAVILVNKLS